MNTLSRVLAAVAVAALALPLAACISIPTSSGVSPGSAIDSDVEQDFISRPSSPRVDAEPEELLRGFIAAGSGTTDDYAVAREFLTAQFAAEWDPQASTLIRQGDDEITASTPSGEAAPERADAVYTATVTASVDAAGHYLEYPDPQATSLSFSFEREGGQWRISAAPNGIVLSNGQFGGTFSQHSLYFFDPSGAFLVPDVRWFPARTQTSTLIVQELLEGPSPWLQGAVRTAFPEGTRLSDLNAVTVDASGIATVDLSPEAREASQAQLWQMQQQVLESLSTVAAASQGVRFTVEQDALPVPEGGAAAEVQPTVDDRALVMIDGEFGFAGDGVNQIGSISEKVALLDGRAVTLNSQLTAAAVLAPSGVWSVQTGDVAPVAVDQRPGLVPPTIDQQDFIWSVPAEQPFALRAVTLAGEQHEVAPGGLPAASDIVSLEVSRDGARLLALVNSDVGPRLVVAGILRTNGVPTALTDTVLEVPLDDGAVLDATWIGPTSIATLSTRAAGASVVQHTIGGQTTSLGTLEGAVQIVGGNSVGGSGGLRALSGDGVVFVRRSSGWSSSITGVSFLGTQQ